MSSPESKNQPTRPSVSACVITLNEEERIRSCLESISWADEIIVVDSHSTDRTLEICREYTEKVYQREWTGYIDQKRNALERVTHDWVLFVDADEELSPGLVEEVKQELRDSAGEWDGFYLPRRVWYLGRWISHGDWYPDYKLRLFRKEHGTIGGVEPHDKVILTGKAKKLRNDLWHFTYRSITDQIERINDFSSISARVLEQAGVKWGFLQFIGRPFAAFVRGYFLRRGFLDGLPGLIIAVTTSFSVFVKYAKLWERLRARQAERARARTEAGLVEKGP